MGARRWIQAIGILGGTVLLHEVAHAVAARRAGGTVREVGIGFGPVLARRRIGGVDVTVRPIPFGGFAAIDIDQLPPDRRRPILLAGPAANIAAGLLLRGLARPRQPVGLPGQTNRLEVGGLLAAMAMLARAADLGPAALARAAGDINLSVGLANLLPVLPLDGGHLAAAHMEAAGVGRTTVNAFRQITAALFAWFAVRVLLTDLARLRTSATSPGRSTPTTRPFPTDGAAHTSGRS
jgi:membrane-associated protease RseP (regulator of RpoE activity)